MEAFMVPAPLLVAIHEYLSKQPYREVAGLIKGIDTECQPLARPETETPPAAPAAVEPPQ